MGSLVFIFTLTGTFGLFLHFFTALSKEHMFIAVALSFLVNMLFAIMKLVLDNKLALEELKRQMK